eukprot:gene19582-biopygen8489
MVVVVMGHRPTGRLGALPLEEYYYSLLDQGTDPRVAWGPSPWRSLGGGRGVPGGVVQTTCAAPRAGRSRSDAKGGHLATKKTCIRAHKATIRQMHCAPGLAGGVRTQKVVIGPPKNRYSGPLAPHQGRIWHPGGTIR